MTREELIAKAIEDLGQLAKAAKIGSKADLRELIEKCRLEWIRLEVLSPPSPPQPPPA